MNNQELLKKKLDVTKAKIKANSKDAHFADALIDELLSIKGQLAIEPTLVHIPMSDVAKSIKSDTYEMAITKRGDAVYHTYGGYTIIADGARMHSLADAIALYVNSDEVVKDLTDQEKELFDTDIETSTFVLNIPAFAFGDPELKYNLAIMARRWIREQFEKAAKTPIEPTPETAQADANFEDAVKAMDALKRGQEE